MVMQATPATLAQNTYALDNLLSDLKDIVGRVNGNDAVLRDAITRVDALIGSAGVSAQIKSNGQALRSKATALTAVQKDVESATASLINAVGELRNGMETNPLYSFLKTPTTNWGTRMYEILGDLLTKTQNFIAQGTALKSRLSGQYSDVTRLMSEIVGTEKAAAGTGALPAISGLISSTVGTTAKSLTGLVWPLAIVAGVVGLIYLTAPQMLKKMKN